jgi:nucleotide-binding universal stress UspA family protein
VRFGAGEALRRACELRLVHAFSAPLIYPPFGAEYDPHDRGPRARMRDLLAHMALDIGRDHPQLSVTTRLIDGSPGGVLVAASREAGLLVVGHRGLGGFAELLAGSVGVQAAGHAHCPVVVRGGPVAADAPIVVGVDGSPGARAAVSAAFDEAHRRGVELFIVHLLSNHALQPESRATAGGYREASTADPVAEPGAVAGVHGCRAIASSLC